MEVELKKVKLLYIIKWQTVQMSCIVFLLCNFDIKSFSLCFLSILLPIFKLQILTCNMPMSKLCVERLSCTCHLNLNELVLDSEHSSIDNTSCFSFLWTALNQTLLFRNKIIVSLFQCFNYTYELDQPIHPLDPSVNHLWLFSVSIPLTYFCAILLVAFWQNSVVIDLQT